MEKIGIEDPPDVAEDVDVREQSPGKIGKNHDEQEKLENVKRKDTDKDICRKEKLKSQKVSEKIPWEGIPWKLNEFWFQGTEFVDMEKFLQGLR